MFRFYNSIPLFNHLCNIWGCCACLLLLPDLISCNRTTAIKMTIVDQKIYEKIPSGSGIAVHNNTAYIIGDDATHVFLLDLKSGEETKIPITGLNPDTYRVAKELKHDFESASIINRDGQRYLMAIGSGGKAIVRDSMMLLNISNHADCRMFSLTGLYDYLRIKTKTGINQWNIEAATVAGGNLILANRGTNSLISLDFKNFLAWIQNPTSNFPTVNIYTLQLPSIQNKEARLSGLCTRSDTEILFCASVEDTPNWISDGPVLGSFIGSYSLSRKAVTFVHLLKKDSGEPISEKVESLDILETNNNKTINVIAIADNDKGSSKIFNIHISTEGLAGNDN